MNVLIINSNSFLSVSILHFVITKKCFYITTFKKKFILWYFIILVLKTNQLFRILMLLSLYVIICDFHFYLLLF